MEFSEMFPVEMRLSECWVGDFVLPNKHEDGLLDCMELAVNNVYYQTGDIPLVSPDTVESIESVNSLLKEIDTTDIDDFEQEIFSINESYNESPHESVSGYVEPGVVEEIIIANEPSSLPSTPSSSVEGRLSPDTDASIESFPDFFEELTGITGIPEDTFAVGGNNALFEDQIECVRPPSVACTSVIGKNQSLITQSLFSDITSLESVKEKSNSVKNSSRRKQRIVPLLGVDDIVPTLNTTSLKLDYKEKLCDESDMDLGIYLGDPMAEKPTNPISRPRASGGLITKVESKERRKRGLSNAEKRDRKKESNRNASYRYRQRKKQEKESFFQHSLSLNKQLENARKSYFLAAEELLRFIKHANLIRAVKDECSQLLLE